MPQEKLQFHKAVEDFTGRGKVKLGEQTMKVRK
jgi:hypothetical protein